MLAQAFCCYRSLAFLNNIKKTMFEKLFYTWSLGQNCFMAMLHDVQFVVMGNKNIIINLIQRFTILRRDCRKLYWYQCFPTVDYKSVTPDFKKFANSKSSVLCNLSSVTNCTSQWPISLLGLLLVKWSQISGGRWEKTVVTQTLWWADANNVKSILPGTDLAILCLFGKLVLSRRSQQSV
jgi:hypothetical protein